MDILLLGMYDKHVGDTARTRERALDNAGTSPEIGYFFPTPIHSFATHSWWEDCLECQG